MEEEASRMEEEAGSIKKKIKTLQDSLKFAVPLDWMPQSTAKMNKAADE